MFSNLADKLQNTLRRLRGKGKLSEQDVDLAMREIRFALLEADVNFKVVKEFVAAIRERAVGEEVMKSLTPGQQVVKIVNEEMTRLLGSENKGLARGTKSPAKVMLVGLQGSGKTTSAVKLALNLRRAGKKTLLVAADIYRPGAVEQLKKLGASVNETVFSLEQSDPVEICSKGLKMGEKESFDYVIFDTAGRLHIDEELMGELRNIKKEVAPDETLMVLDAMTGQDAVNAAVSFNETIGLNGIILTKLDGDTRGGAALSVRSVTGCPIKYTGTGEKVDALEPFYPERMASRILGMGDVLSFIEKAEAAVDREKALDLEKKLRSNQFTLNDFRDQLEQLKKMGSLEQIMEMIPAGMGLPKEMKQLAVNDDSFKKIEAVIGSMTEKERLDPLIINSSRRKRIAGGSGTSVQDVNKLLSQFAQMQKMFKKMNSVDKKTLNKLKKSHKGFPYR